MLSCQTSTGCFIGACMHMLQTCTWESNGAGIKPLQCAEHQSLVVQPPLPVSGVQQVYSSAWLVPRWM